MPRHGFLLGPVGLSCRVNNSLLVTKGIKIQEFSDENAKSQPLLTKNWMMKPDLNETTSRFKIKNALMTKVWMIV